MQSGGPRIVSARFARGLITRGGGALKVLELVASLAAYGSSFGLLGALSRLLREWPVIRLTDSPVHTVAVLLAEGLGGGVVVTLLLSFAPVPAGCARALIAGRGGERILAAGTSAVERVTVAYAEKILMDRDISKPGGA